MSAEKIDLSRLVSSEVEGLVAVEPRGDGQATFFMRDRDGTVSEEDVPFAPWLLVSGPALAEELENASSSVQLSGEGIHAVRVHFPSLDAYYDATKALKKLTGFNPSSPQGPYRLFSDLTQQVLSMHPARLFRGLEFSDIRRLQIDIETLTTPGYDFPNAEREGDQIIMIAMRDSSGWEQLLHGGDMDEAEMLRAMVTLVRERDPDVIEGHNIFNFDLPYIETRAKRHKVRLDLGRDGRRMKGRSSRFTAGDRTSTYRRYDIFGRHVVDTLHLVQLYDVAHRDMDSYGLKAAAVYFGVASPDRTYVDGSKISQIYREDPERLRAYAMDDVRETDAISKILSPSYFYQAQLVPYSYQNCVSRGNATRIDALLCAEYMRENASLPTPQAPRRFQGGLTGSIRSGVFENVWHADVRSLYPSIIISKQLNPRSDHLGVFNRLLSELRDFRLLAKDVASSAEGERREHFEALQSSFKILINSFYGYTGFPLGTFNDFDLAETVTAEGRRILQAMLDFLQERGATVIEMDTDGIYFVPPEDVHDTATMQEEIQAILPEGIEIDLDATYKAMLGYKAKNYALLGNDGMVAVTGAALKSRGLEPFQRNYMHDLISLLLTRKSEEASALFERYKQQIEEHKLPLSHFAKREVLSTAPKTYAEKLAAGKTRRSAAYELVLGADREYSQGDTVAFYVTGDKKTVAVSDAAKLLTDAAPDKRDENIKYYLGKLEKLHKKFAPFLG